MNLSEREELRLVLLRDASVGQHMWLDRWQVSYPQVIAAECSAHEALNLQNQRLQAAIGHMLQDDPETGEVFNAGASHTIQAINKDGAQSVITPNFNYTFSLNFYAMLHFCDKYLLQKIIY